jgi:hypothetical protein
VDPVPGPRRGSVDAPADLGRQRALARPRGSAPRARPVPPASQTFAAGTHGNTISVSFGSLTAAAQPWRLEIDTTSTTIPPGLDPDETGMLDRTVIAGMVVIVHYSLTPTN